ncbi:hypothetical protein [Allorhodopirellula heiligendammensis]|uniref:Uncharacterized protein n=1 Tax=Allorhodopirellula heiligendammensis TaxID=2714739 RepID=A0A5C6BUK8_9BACT|nr:hypothetical protein [Allorhodopirellula heiligendammensis]TWU15953.1 hypothetical protein Poly21_31570 [Allorhodopirellula heiligendammensis]
MIIAPSIAPRLWFHVLDADSLPVDDLATADISAAAYVTITAGVRSSAATITLGAKVADTAAHATGQLVTIHADDGWYAIDAPAGAALATADYAELVVTLDDGTRLLYPTLHAIESAVIVPGSSPACSLYPVPKTGHSIVPIHITGGNGAPITDLDFETPGLSIEYKLITETSYTAITLANAIEGTYTDGGFVAEAAGGGWYQLGLPDDAKVEGKTTRLRVKTAGNEYVFGTIYTPITVASGSPASPDFTGITATGGRITLDVKQRDDYSATDGRAFTWTVTQPGIDFTDGDVVIGAAGGRAAGYSTDEVAATMTLRDKAVGSATVQIEFTSAQLDVPAKTYPFDAHVLVDGRRVTTTEVTLNVLPKYADAAP